MRESETREYQTNVSVNAKARGYYQICRPTNLSRKTARKFQLTRQEKNFNFAIRHFQKKKTFNLTIDPLSLGIHAPGPQVLT